MTNFYLWFKTLHIIAVISWMAGMLYLPRLFVYHAGAPSPSQQFDTFIIMEGKLLRIIMLPAMIVTWGTGLFLAIQGSFFSSGWLMGKLVLVLALSALHGFLARVSRQFASGKNPYSGKFYRIINEIPTVLLIFIVLLVVLKPF